MHKDIKRARTVQRQELDIAAAVEDLLRAVAVMEVDIEAQMRQREEEAQKKLAKLQTQKAAVEVLG